MNRTPSVNLTMYEISEQKDMSIKNIERYIKEAAFDCALNYNRNIRPDSQDNTRDCDYTKCDYSCDDIPMNNNPWEPEEIKNLDLSSYQVYYNHDNVKVIINKLKIKFKTYFKLELNQIFDFFKDYLKFDIINALRTIYSNK